MNKMFSDQQVTEKSKCKGTDAYKMHYNMNRKLHCAQYKIQEGETEQCHIQ